MQNCSMPGALRVAGSSSHARQIDLVLPWDRKGRTSPAKIRRDVIRCLICCSNCSVIIVEYLGDVLFCDPGWVSPNCRRHPQFMPSLFSKSLRFRRLKWKMWLRQVVSFDIMPYQIDGATIRRAWRSYGFTHCDKCRKTTDSIFQMDMKVGVNSDSFRVRRDCRTIFCRL